jgi:hypothetical protein
LVARVARVGAADPGRTTPLRPHLQRIVQR